MAEVKKSWKFLIVLAIIGGLFGAHPYIVARVVAGDAWQGVVPEFWGDSLNYMTRANAAIHGKIITGNPHYETIYDAPSPSFSAADGITGIPYAFLSPMAATVWNAFLWNVLFWLLVGVILIYLGYSRSMVIVFCFVVASSTFGYMLRVTNMQTIFPFFLLFFILLLLAWHRDRLKTEPKYSYVFLGFFAGIMTYLYTFLFQIVAVSLVVGALLALTLGRMRLARSLLASIAIMTAIAIPYVVYFYGIRDFPAFGDTMNYFFAVRSHFPSPGVYFYGRWLVLLFVWSFLLWQARKWTRKSTAVPGEATTGPSLEDVVLTVATISLGILGVMLENIITGVDLAGIGHANYFGRLLLSLGLVLLIWPTMRVFSEKGAYVRKALLLLCVLVIAVKVFVMLPGEFPIADRYRVNSAGPQFVRPTGNLQYIRPVLSALGSLPETHVVAAPDLLVGYIPLYTKQHVLYGGGGIFGVSTIENTERRLTSKLGESLTPEDVIKASDDSGGGGDSEVMGRNKLARRLCTMLVRSPSCATLIVARIYHTEGLVAPSAWFDYYQKAIRPNVVKYLRRFNVSQVVIDRRLPLPEFLREQTPWYSDQYYAIYDITDETDSYGTN
ncbi:MAG: hypothetical protein A2942_00255 [Candidatus Lloydbacteria bacterium RIFCSPLOWO2_01_FULL_50_20]|uniref:Glycosyltransferase RgtA/B/C/D-like domain-containing protein n=1 Tax=Candidatus Lloydbacteria bacterium RIFCSPLOWO2_01_FULL_50_20 TaxID=1798665 RepID=A0A1G2DI33_9BACT|nr:MAG: hypothetical protein A3C13_04600 [Candidatus Lloydbacteria bacterium RIFCSPHIGHO2_02_FULL_50_11]OGZ12530.1 MAG: hypothetical protein A2942_00255 [Candidatus Lloydbacteria bacterium RIFCSPLOWO2_01_FULL_50_20]